jgi:hypothetical protein
VLPDPSPNPPGVEGGLPDTAELKLSSGVTGRDVLMGELVEGAPSRERVEDTERLGVPRMGGGAGTIPARTA